jgi:hypothetical protein
MHTSTTDTEARLYKKSPGTGALLCFIGHALMENSSGLIVQGDLTQADDQTAEPGGSFCSGLRRQTASPSTMTDFSKTSTFPLLAPFSPPDWGLCTLYQGLTETQTGEHSDQPPRRYRCRYLPD